MTKDQFNKLYDSSYKMILHWYMNAGLDRHTAEDAAQQLFMDIWRCLKDKETYGGMQRYFFVASRNRYRKEVAEIHKHKDFENQVLREIWLRAVEKGLTG